MREYVDRLAAALVAEHPGWSIEEVLETVSADTWHEYEQAKRAGNTIVAVMSHRAHTEVNRRIRARERSKNDEHRTSPGERHQHGDVLQLDAVRRG